ncbi:hypothetical protein GQX74_013183 [Glossina fuscipes]|nr:hypothetical protein GQX74_013183 [Glossina fuscipes]
MCCLTPTLFLPLPPVFLLIKLVIKSEFGLMMSYDIPSCTSESLIHSVLCVVISLLIVSCAYVASSCFLFACQLIAGVSKRGIMLIWSTVSVLSVDVSCSLTWWSCQVPRRSTSLRRSYEASVHYQY